MVWTAETSAMVSAMAAVVAAGFAGASCWLYLRELQRRDVSLPPVVEGTATWLPLKNRFRLVVTVRNRADFTIAVKRIAITRPRGTTIGWDDERHKAEGEISTWKYIDLERILGRMGSVTAVVGRQIESDVATIRIHCKPPPGWVSGKIVVSVRVQERTGNRHIHQLNVQCDLPPQPPVA